MTTRVTLPADVHQIDSTGYVWSFLDDADDQARIVIGGVIVAGDSDDPFLARVVGIVAGNSAAASSTLKSLACPTRSSTNCVTPTFCRPDLSIYRVQATPGRR